MPKKLYHIDLKEERNASH